MLAEMLLYRLTRAAPWAQAMGYREGAVRLWSRHGRCRRVWAPHLENTRNFVGEAARAVPGDGTALVLGSGLLADVPLDVLRAKFRRVVLVDVVHLPTTRWRTRRMADVTHVVADLTGTARELVADPAGSLPEPGCDFGLDDPTVDFVVSLNLVSQLPLAPVEWLEAHGRREADAAAYGGRIVAAHFAYLKRFACPVCVVGDLTRTYLDKAGQPIETDDALYGFVPPPTDAQWTWDLAPLGELDRKYAIRNRVFAIRELRESNRLV
ncbi:MAG: hypothetical protein HY059_01535 [Proteobacteria bacterium]|nr:hypothetical protein [Pseudomonadota bacterium]